MKFGLIDAIRELDRGKRIVAVKAVSLAEEYLADHFPTFPVLPGVFMLEALAEAAAWLVRDALDFAPDVILLREARNVTYRSFVKPGQVLRVEVTSRRIDADGSDFDGAGFCGDVEAVRARFGLRHLSLPLHNGTSAPARERSRDQMKARFALLRATGSPGHVGA